MMVQTTHYKNAMQQLDALKYVAGPKVLTGLMMILSFFPEYKEELVQNSLYESENRASLLLSMKKLIGLHWSHLFHREIMKRLLMLFLLFNVCTICAFSQSYSDTSCYVKNIIPENDLKGIIQLIENSGFQYITSNGSAESGYWIIDNCVIPTQTLLTCVSFKFSSTKKATNKKMKFQKRGNKLGRYEMIEIVLNHNRVTIRQRDNILDFIIEYETDNSN